MPQFFFDFHDNDALHVDEEGGEIVSRERARAEAIQALAHIVKDSLPDGEQHCFSVDMRDDAGRLLYRARLMFEGGWTG